MPPKKGKGRGKGGHGPSQQPSAPTAGATASSTQHGPSQQPSAPTPGATASSSRHGPSQQPTAPIARATVSSTRHQPSTPTPGATTSSTRHVPSQQPSTPTTGATASRTQKSQASAAEPGEEMLQKFAGISLEHKASEQSKKRFSIMKRPGYGQAGRPIALLANYFVLKFKDVSAYHYDVDILEVGKDKKPGRSLLAAGRTAKEDMEKKVGHVEHQQKRNLGKAKCREIISKFLKLRALQNYNPVYDGQKNIYTSQPFPIKDKKISIVDMEIDGRMKSYCIAIQPVQKEDGTNIISLEPLREVYKRKSTEMPQEVILLFDSIMNHRDPPFSQVQIRNSFFFLDQPYSVPLGSGLEIWFGYNQSVRLAEAGPVVVINVAAKAFHKACNVIDYACDVLQQDITRAPKLENWQTLELDKALRGVRVKVTHQRQPRKYKIKALTKQSARDLMLKMDDKNISVAQYFQQKYNYKLKCPLLPCLHMQTSNPTTYIPMETCEVVEGQVKLGKLSGDLTSQMIKKTAVPAPDRFNYISEDARTVNNISGNLLKAYGLLMDVTLMKLNGRVITAPQLAYGGDKPSRFAKPDNRGVWRIEDGKEFYRVKKVDRWIMFSFANERFCNFDKLKRCAECLISSSRKCGLRFGQPIEIKIMNRNSKTEDALLYAKKCDAEFAIVVLNRKDPSHSYEEVKFLADFKYGVVTQCIEDKTLGRINDQITTNLCLKINAKLGGINHIIFQRPQIFARPVIVFGADAIHWTRGLGYPSIAAVVGSLDPTASKYALTCSLQEQRKDKMSQEIIVKMKDIVKGILTTFQNVNFGKRPEKIIFFRDGVSEGQFVTVLEEEVSSIQKACLELYNVILPITFLVVQKRHQTRLRPQDNRDSAGKCGNVPPGTTVDTTITHPVFFDFFVCSHEGIQGTSKPAHYTVLHDDNKLGADELQQLSYFLCHTYVRCTRSVSLPAPVLYADLAASRAKTYADLFVHSDTASTSSSEPVNRPLPRHVVEAIESMKSFENNMFYV